MCDGYSKAFKLLMDKLGIRCGIVSGETIRSSGGHSWNYVLIDGDYYWIDVTWDDPVGQDPNEVKRELLHTYFCITDEQLLRNHILDSNLLFVPQCTSLTYNYMRKNGLLMDEYSFDGFNRIFSGITDHISVQFGNADAFYSAVGDLISGNAIYSTDYMKENDKHSYSYSADDEQYVLSIYVK